MERLRTAAILLYELGRFAWRHRRRDLLKFNCSSGDTATRRIRVTLAETWNGQDPSGYWLSEKLDGMRCLWDGQALRTRTGKRVHAPQALVMQLPSSMSLDGELIVEGGAFEQCAKVVRDRSPDARDWTGVRFMVFDAPSVPTDFGQRIEEARRALAVCPWVHVVEHTRCTGAHHVLAELERVVSLGGEGVMLRKPSGSYRGGRSADLLKVKMCQDAEAVVRAHVPGEGKHASRISALMCADGAGRRFEVSIGAAVDRAAPPAVGTTITYKFQQRTACGLPRFPVFVRVRPEE